MKPYYVLLLLTLGSSCRQVATTPTEHSPLTKLIGEDGNQWDPAFSADGKYLAYQSDQTGSPQIFMYNFHTGESSQLTYDASRKSHLQWSADQQYLSVTERLGDQTRIVLVDFSGSASRPLTEWGENASNARWSHNESLLVFDKNDVSKDLWLYDLNTQTQRPLLSLDADETNFGFSYDDQWVGYNVRGGENNHLHAVHVATGETRPLVPERDGYEWLPRWTPNSLEVSFYTTWDGEMTDIWLTPIESTELERITDGAVEEFGPATSGNARLLSYFIHDGEMDIRLHDRTANMTHDMKLAKELIVLWNPMDWHPFDNKLVFSGTTEYTRLHVKSISTMEQRPYLPDKEKGHQLNPAIDPNRELVAYGNQHHDIVLHNQTTGEEQRIKPLESHHFAKIPRWIPGQPTKLSLIYGEGGSSSTNNLWMVDLTTQERIPITKKGGVNKPYCWVSEDLVAFAYDATTSYSDYEIWTHHLPTEKMQKVLGKKGASFYPTDSFGGDRLLFHSNMNGAENIYEYSFASDSYALVDTGLNQASNARYSPDGESIAFISNDNPEGFPDIFIKSSNSALATRLTTSKETEAHLAWLNDDELIYEFTRSNQDLYLLDVDAKISQVRAEDSD